MNQRLTCLGIALALGAGGAACGDGSAKAGADASLQTDTAVGSDGPRPDGGTTDGSAPGPLGWAGLYDADGVWDLSGPLTAQTTLGEVVAELMVKEIVSRAGVPSAVESQAQSAVRSLVGDEIKALVDASAPEALRPGSALRTKLAAVLATTQVASTITLLDGAPVAAVRGTEVLASFTFSFQGRPSTLPAGDLLDRTGPLVTLGADWKGTQLVSDQATIEPHAFALRFGKMILWIVNNVLQETAASSLSQTAAALVDCGAISAAITDGQPSFSFGVGALSYSVGTSSLTAGCAAAAGVVGNKALGLFDLDAGVEVGGPVQALDDDADAVGIADRLKSLPGFGGVVTKGPPGLAPRVTVRFEALRRAEPPTASLGR